MHLVEASVYVLASTRLHYSFKEPVPGLVAMLADLGVPNWRTDTDSHMDTLSEICGRLCYMSFEPGLNPNVTKIREGNEAYVQNIAGQKHGSVFEHSYITFAFLNCSRVLTHELVRHRAGMAYSQQSMRYVRLTDLPMVLPDELMQDQEMAGQVQAICASVEEFLAAVTKFYDLDNCSFSKKKQITSAMRRLVPQGVGTHIIWTANLRALRHLLEMRTSEGAEEEIRRAFNTVGQYAQCLAPAAFSDFSQSNGVWAPVHSKV